MFDLRILLPLIVFSLASTSAWAGNLLVDGDGAAGLCTQDSEASSTVPGWTVISGAPAILCRAGDLRKAAIANGPWGDSALGQTIDVGAAAKDIDAGTVSATLSGTLGRSGPGKTAVAARFIDAAGHETGPALSLSDSRAVSGPVPSGTRAIAISLAFTGGKDDTVWAADLGLTLSADLPAPVLAPPPASVPAFDHVFLIMMENTDFTQVIGDTANAPYINGLAGRGVLFANYNAVYHPSDENYLAIAGGDTFVAGGVYFPKLHVAQRNIADTLEDAGKSWKTYEQGMGEPCNTTTKYDRNYEPDDTPFVLFADIIDDKPRCRAHLVDTDQLSADLQSAATTPNFAWIAADAFYDGEDSGDGSPASLRAQDAWLRTTLTPLFASPAWTKERSLLILTWDESATEANNHIATFVIGSQGLVRSSVVSQRHHDHYDVARTIEAALGLPPLTANDRYAEPLNEAFTASDRPKG